MEALLDGFEGAHGLDVRDATTVSYGWTIQSINLYIQELLNVGQSAADCIGNGQILSLCEKEGHSAPRRHKVQA